MVTLSHDASKCKFRFKKRCFSCNQFHFSLLCSSADQKETDMSCKTSHNVGGNQSRDVNAVNTSSVWVNESKISFSEHHGEDVIVPTFNIVCSPEINLTAMRDSGCQSSFITEAAADKLNLKIIHSDIPLIVHGFNSSEKYLTKIVELAIDPEEPPIRPICMPIIRTKIKLPGLSKVVNGFTNKGYMLADSYLLRETETISGIDLIVGNNDSNVILQQDVKFGSNPSSGLSRTSRGVMLGGSIGRMLVAQLTIFAK